MNHLEPSVNDLTIIVNTSDPFDDCWDAFFTLFERFWPDNPWPIVLNTETKTYVHPRLQIRSSCVARGEPERLTWSECLIRCLDSIDTPFVLYLQEDFFLEARVQSALFDHMVDTLRSGKADAVRLMECGGSGPWTPTDDPLLWEVDQKSPYLIALQAALWRKSTLRGYLRKHESPWQLESFGSVRARRAGDKILCVNRDRFHGHGKEIWPYEPTGIVSGKWEKRIVEPLFRENAIEMDFSRRGFYDSTVRPRKRPFASRLMDRVRSLV